MMVKLKPDGYAATAEDKAEKFNVARRKKHEWKAARIK